MQIIILKNKAILYFLYQIKYFLSIKIKIMYYDVLNLINAFFHYN